MAARHYASQRQHESEIDRSEAERQHQRKVEELERQNARLRATVNALEGTLRAANRLMKPYCD